MKLNIGGKHIEYGFIHIRNVNYQVRPDRLVTDVTYCKLYIDGIKYLGLASCVEGDNFNKETGRKSSLARALKDAKLDRRERGLIWANYFGRAIKDIS